MGAQVIIGSEAVYKDAVAALKRVQEFDVATLPREGDLGAKMNLREAVEPARALVELFQRLSLAALDDFPDGVLEQIKSTSNNVFQLFSQALQFDPDQGNPQGVRQQIVGGIRQQYPTVFQQLHPVIAYSLHRAADFQRLDAQARATLQSVSDQAGTFAGQMKQYERDAARVLEEIRKVAAEEGVSQQAAHFRVEADGHEAKASEWQTRTGKVALLLGGFAVISLFLHKIAWIAPTSAYETVQLAISKVLIFAVITYMLVLAARNFMSHKHNAIVNRHRQNALMTHRALVEAAAESGVRDAIMVQAAGCIFAPQSTGYTSGKAEGEAFSPRSVVEILSKTTPSQSGG